MEALKLLWESTGLFNFVDSVAFLGPRQFVMIGIGLVLIYFAVKKEFEPLLLLPIGFGGILANIPIAGITISPNHLEHLAHDVIAMDPEKWVTYLGQSLSGLVPRDQLNTIVQGAVAAGAGGAESMLVYLQEHVGDITPGLLGVLAEGGLYNGLFPLLIFMGVGALTDFGPLLANPKTALLGAAAQFGIFATLLGALAMSDLIPGIDFNLRDASAIGIIGGADGPTSIFVASRLAPDLLGAIAVSAYSYMALVPIIQPPIMRALTSKDERCIVMRQLRPVKKVEKICFPLLVLGLCVLLLPSATPLIGALCFGNLVKESGVVERLSKTAQNELINIVTIFLGLSVGSKLAAEKFLQLETLGILILGLVAFSIGTAAGVLLAKLMNALSKDKINPLIGAAGVSAVPMAARVVNKVGLEDNHQNMLLMHAMGPNVSGVIGSAVAAGVLLALCG